MGCAASLEGALSLLSRAGGCRSFVASTKGVHKIWGQCQDLLAGLGSVMEAVGGLERANSVVHHPEHHEGEHGHERGSQSAELQSALQQQQRLLQRLQDLACNWQTWQRLLDQISECGGPGRVAEMLGKATMAQVLTHTQMLYGVGLLGTNKDDVSTNTDHCAASSRRWQSTGAWRPSSGS